MSHRCQALLFLPHIVHQHPVFDTIPFNPPRPENRQLSPPYTACHITRHTRQYHPTPDAKPAAYRCAPATAQQKADRRSADRNGGGAVAALAGPPFDLLRSFSVGRRAPPPPLHPPPSTARVTRRRAPCPANQPGAADGLTGAVSPYLLSVSASRGPVIRR